FSVVSKERLPTYIFIVFEFGKTTDLQSRSRESGFKPPMSDAHLTIYRALKLKQSNPISAHYRPDRAKHKRLFHSAFPRRRFPQCGPPTRQVPKKVQWPLSP